MHGLRSLLCAAVLVVALGMPAGAAAAPRIDGYPTFASSAPAGIAVGPDGAIWFAARGAERIGRIDPATKAVTGVAVTGCGPYGIATGPDAAVWFTCIDGDKLGRLDPLSGVPSYHLDAALAGDAPAGIAVGVDAALWITLSDGDMVARVDPAAPSVVAEYPDNDPNHVLDEPLTIVSHPNGRLYFSSRLGDNLWSIETTGSIRFEHQLAAGARNDGLAVTPDQDIYIAEGGGAALTHYRPGTPSFVQRYPTLADSAPRGVAATSDGTVWFTGETGGRAGRIAPGASATEEFTVEAASDPFYAITTPDDYVWFTGRTSGKVYRLAPERPPTAITGDASGVTQTAATLSGKSSPRAFATSAFFEYGATASYGRTTAEQAIGDGEAAVTVSAAIGELAPGTTFHYRLVARNSNGTTNGEDRTFTTASPPAPSPPGGGAGAIPTATPIPVVPAIVSSRFAATRTRTRILRLRVNGVPADGAVEVRCTRSKKRCPFTRRKAKVTGKGTSDLLPLFKRRKLPVGTRIEVRITAPGYLGKVVTFAVRSRKRPKQTLRCLPPGARATQACPG